MDLIVRVKNQALKCKQDAVSKSVNFVKAHFTFDDEWIDTTKNVIFRNDMGDAGEVSIEVVLPEDNTVIVPWEVLAEVGSLYISVVGHRQEGDLPVTITTLEMENPIDVLESGDLGGSTPKDPTPSVWDSKEDKSNKSTDLEADRDSKEKYPNVADILRYIDAREGVTHLSEDTYVKNLSSGVYSIDGLDGDYALWLDDTQELGLSKGIALVVEIDSELWEWIIIGLDSAYNSVSYKGNSLLTEEEGETFCFINSVGEIESTYNRVSDFLTINNFNYPTTRAVVDYTLDQLKDFKETELDYTRIYKYYREQLEDTNVLNGSKAFSVKSQIVSHIQGSTEIGKVIWYQFEIAMAMKENGEDLVRLVDSPLDFKVKNDGYITITNTDQLKDIGVIAEGYPIMYREHINEEFAEEMGVVTKCTLSFSSSNITSEGTSVVYLRCELSIYVSSQAVAETLKDELDDMLAYYSSTFLLKYENLPETEIVNAPYLGGK